RTAPRPSRPPGSPRPPAGPRSPSLRRRSKPASPNDARRRRKRGASMYSAEISRKNPGCFIFLLDQSASMEDPFGGSADRKKADELATIINKLIHNLSIRCAKGDSMYDYFHVAVIGYGQDTVVKSAFDGPLTGKDLIPMSELANNPLRIEDRTKKADDGAGGLVEQTVKFPLWFEAKHAGGTPMSSAFKTAAEMVQRWVAEHPKGFPPI